MRRTRTEALPFTSSHAGPGPGAGHKRDADVRRHPGAGHRPRGAPRRAVRVDPDVPAAVDRKLRELFAAVAGVPLGASRLGNPSERPHTGDEASELAGPAVPVEEGYR